MWLITFVARLFADEDEQACGGISHESQEAARMTCAALALGAIALSLWWIGDMCVSAIRALWA